MKWVTRECVHLDRVASPWLIKRFVDSEAEFVFVGWNATADRRPIDAIPFGIPGVELGAHDEQGTTFEKILRKYHLDDHALSMLGEIIASGVHHALHEGPDRDKVKALEGIGLDALSEGIMLLAKDDRETIDLSMPIYDGLYQYCRAHLLLQSDPQFARGNLVERTQAVRQALSAPAIR